MRIINIVARTAPGTTTTTTSITRRQQQRPPTQKQALRAVTVSALLAAFVAIIVCAAIAIPLAILSRDFNNQTAQAIEGVSKIVASICLLQLSLKMPKFFGLYYSKSQIKNKQKKNNQKKRKNHEQTTATTIDRDDVDYDDDDDDDDETTLSLRSIRFNVAWNIWREVAECGVFLIPFFLSGEGILAIPLSAVVGFVCGAVVCLLIYYANKHFKSTVGLTIFTTGLLLLLSTGLFSGGCHNIETVAGSTETVWTIHGSFWSVDRLPATLLKPFGYSDTRTVLQIVTFWSWLAFGLVLHFIKYKQYCKPSQAVEEKDDQEVDGDDDDDDDDDSRTRNTVQTRTTSTVSPTDEPVSRRNTFEAVDGAAESKNEDLECGTSGTR